MLNGKPDLFEANTIDLVSKHGLHDMISLLKSYSHISASDKVETVRKCPTLFCLSDPIQFNILKPLTGDELFRHLANIPMMLKEEKDRLASRLIDVSKTITKKMQIEGSNTIKMNVSVILHQINVIIQHLNSSFHRNVQHEINYKEFQMNKKNRVRNFTHKYITPYYTKLSNNYNKTRKI